MLFVDPRQGSDNLYVSLKKAGLPVELADPQLPFGDVYFVGRGTNGSGINIGIEHKSVNDLVNSLQTARLQGHQLIGMRADYDLCWLIIEGKPMRDRQGHLVYKSKHGIHRLGMTINELYKRLTVLHLCGGLNWVWFHSRKETVDWFTAFYQTWTDKSIDEHKSHLALYEAPTLAPVSQFERTVRTLPQVGPQVAKAAKKRFGSIKNAITAFTMDWATLSTIDDKGKERMFGANRAVAVCDAITKEHQ